jgi:lysophospholipase L1-like esterase
MSGTIRLVGDGINEIIKSSPAVYKLFKRLTRRDTSTIMMGFRLLVGAAVLLSGSALNAERMPPLAPRQTIVAPSDRPVPRTDRNSEVAHRELLAKAKRGRIDVYFVGDSIIRRWGALDYPDFLANWRENFFGWNAANFGWGADRIENILWRLANGEIDGVHPKIIVVQAGANNVGREPGGEPKVADITRGIKAIIDLCRAKAPQASIVLTAIFPRNDSFAVIPEINQINRNIATLADGRQVRYLDVNDKLADADGRLFDGMTVDGLHPTIRGYQIWADGLKPIFTEILGPPAPIDQAPPPTGDPSFGKRPRAALSKRETLPER